MLQDFQSASDHWDLLTQVFSCEILEIFKNSFLYRTPLHNFMFFSESQDVFLGEVG